MATEPPTSISQSLLNGPANRELESLAPSQATQSRGPEPVPPPTPLLSLEGSVTMTAELSLWNLPRSPPGHSLCSLYITNPQPGKQRCLLQAVLTSQTLHPPLTPLLSTSSSRGGCRLPSPGDGEECLERLHVLSCECGLCPYLAHGCGALSGSLHSAESRDPEISGFLLYSCLG